MKKIIALLLSLSMVLSVSPVTYAKAADQSTQKNSVTTKTGKTTITVTYKTSTGFEKGKQRIQVPKGSLEVPESALTEVPDGYRIVSIPQIKGRFLTVTVEPIPTTKKVNAIFVNGKDKVGDAFVTIEDNATTVTKDDVKDLIPKNYVFVSAGNINSKNVVTVKVKPATTKIRVNYETSTGVDKGNERIDVAKGALEIKESALTQIPEGFKVVSISGIKNNTVTVIVEEIPTTKEVNVVYLNGKDKVGEEVVTVAIDATTVDEKDLTLPKNYKFVKATTITTQDTVKVTVKPMTTKVRVNYETSSGMDKGNERIDVVKGSLEIQESALTRIPKGYKVVSISEIKNNTVTVIVEEIPTTKEVTVVYLNGKDKVGEEVITVAIDATTVDEKDLTLPKNYKFVKATTITTQDTVKVTVKPVTTQVRVNYKTSTDVQVGDERVEVNKGALEIQESALIHIPEGYKVVAISAIENGEVTATVEKIATTKEVKVVYLNGKDKVGEEVVTVAIDATHVDEAALTIPENYKFVKATNITTQDTVKVTVEPINGPVDPEDPENPENPDPETPENPNPETPENPNPETPETPNPENPEVKPEVTPEVKPEVTPDKTDDSELKSDSQITEKPAAASTGTNKYDVPQTGDSNEVTSWLILMISSLALLVVSSVKRRRTK